MDLVSTAMEFARHAHHGQVWKCTGEPYIVHPFAVAGLITAVDGSDTMVAAAFLHGVVKHTSIPIETIAGLFGLTVTTLVELARLGPEYMLAAGPDVQTLKLASRIDNIKTISLCDPEFARIYMNKTQEFLPWLSQGNQQLFNIAAQLTTNYFQMKGNKND